MGFLDFARTLPRIEVGDCREVLARLPERSVHCVVTSPPYWGLRKYPMPPVVWGGDAGCKHRWGKTRKMSVGRRDPGSGNPTVGLAGNTRGAVSPGPRESDTGQFCLCCSAWRGHLGNEPTPALYVAHLIECFRAVRRVLRDDGTLWLNLGDSYSGSGINDGSVNPGISKARQRGDVEGRRHDAKAAGLKSLDLVGIPWAVAAALRADGWWLRSDVVWHNINSMPENQQGWRWERCRVKTAPRGIGKTAWRIGQVEGLGGKPQRDHSGDVWFDGAMWKPCPGCLKCKPNGGLVLRRGAWRPTGAHEYVFLLVKTPDYFCDGDAVRQLAVTAGDVRHLRGNAKQRTLGASLCRAGAGSPTSGANLRDVWVFPTESLREAHFAVFPRRLPELCIKASTSERGCCPACGAPWARVVERERGASKDCPKTAASGVARGGRSLIGTLGQSGSGRVDGWTKTLDWRPTCACPLHEPIPCVVLDPFAGSGTTLRVAEDLGRLWLGVDLSDEYLKIMRKRTAQRTVFGAVGQSAVERALAHIAPLTEGELLQGWETAKRRARSARGRRA